jgi:hypothetical protein
MKYWAKGIHSPQANATRKGEAAAHAAWEGENPFWVCPSQLINPEKEL